MRGAGSQCGFTLMELLVSLVLLGLMMTLIGMAVPLAMTAAARTSMLSNEFGAIENAQHLLRRQIGEMPPLVTQAVHAPKSLFSGAVDSMRFAAIPVAAQGGGGPRFIDLSVVRQGGAMRLIYAAGAEKRDLVVNAQRINFFYFGRRTPDKTPQWHDEWRDAPQPPRLVRIQVRPVIGALPWPDLVIAVKAGPAPP